MEEFRGGEPSDIVVVDVATAFASMSRAAWCVLAAVLLSTTNVAQLARVSESRPSDAPPGMVLVPGGKIRIGMDPGEFEAVKTSLGTRDFPEGMSRVGWPAHEVELDDFYIDVDEVTNKCWSEFMRDTGRGPPKGWRGEIAENLPVTNVSVDEAELYLAWCGKRLPTEFEWEAAARYTPPGDKTARWWPWGDTHDPTKTYSGLGLTPVGSFPEGRSALGINDLAANAHELTSSGFLPFPGWHAGTGQNANPMFSGSVAVLRGGGRFGGVSETLTTARVPMLFYRSESVGFRGARSRTSGRDLFASLLQETRFGSPKAVGPSLNDEKSGRPEITLRDATRYAALMSGGWDPKCPITEPGALLGHCVQKYDTVLRSHVAHGHLPRDWNGRDARVVHDGRGLHRPAPTSWKVLGPR